VYSESLAKKNDLEEVLCYFIFPTIGMPVPMRNTDILLFDSSFGHCVTNYRHDDAFIFSLFTGSMTALTIMAAEAKRN
jgi:hypothetical protein